jgi:hypothetical protein
MLAELFGAHKPHWFGAMPLASLRLYPLRDRLCQFGIPKLMLGTPEPFGSSLGVASFQRNRPTLFCHASLPFSPPKHLKPSTLRPIQPQPSSFPHLTLLLTSQVTLSLERVHHTPLPIPSPGVFHRLMELDSCKDPQ